MIYLNLNNTVLSSRSKWPLVHALPVCKLTFIHH